MVDSTWDSNPAAVRHTLLVRVTHWLNALCFLALLVSGVEILISHPRLYWGETGNVNTAPLIQFPIPASRATVPTGYGYVLPDQNGWSRALHFQSAWFVAFAGLAYVFGGLLRRKPPLAGSAYNRLQRGAYLGVVFVIFPAAFWTGLAMAPGFTAAFPLAVESLGGHQSARTLHFVVAVLLTLFLCGHLAMIARAGFRTHVRAMLTGAIREDA
jgi:thiosulfate reductase cytochrome b subunit